MAYEYIELNLIPTGEKPVFHAAQYDVGRPIIIKLKNGEDDFTPTGLDLELQVRKVDNNIVTAVPDSVDGNVVTFLSTQQMTACSGTNLGKIQITKDDLDIATLLFYLVVQRDVLAGGLTSQSEIHDLEDQIAVLVPEVIGDEYYTAEQVDEKIAEIPTFDPDDYYDKTQLYTKTETNGLLAQKANTSSLAAVATSGSYNDLINKPNIPDVSDYYTKSETYSQNEVNTLLSAKADTSSLAAVATSGDYDDLLNKPTIPAAQVQADWSQADNTQVDFIKNKPTIPTNAELLPISSSDPTNTKDYIDTVLSGKVSTTDLANGSATLGTNISGNIYYKKFANMVWGCGRITTDSTIPVNSVVFSGLPLNNIGVNNVIKAIDNDGVSADWVLYQPTSTDRMICASAISSGKTYTINFIYYTAN